MFRPQPVCQYQKVFDGGRLSEPPLGLDTNRGRRASGIVKRLVLGDDLPACARWFVVAQCCESRGLARGEVEVVQAPVVGVGSEDIGNVILKHLFQ